MNRTLWKGSYHALVRRVLLLSLAVVGLVVLIAAPAEAQPHELQAATIERAVITAITKLKDAPPAHGTFIDVMRGGDQQSWAFGSVVLLTPKQDAHAPGHAALPEARLWLAQQTSAGWEAAIDYTPRFNQWLQEAPLSVVSAKEKTILSTSDLAPPGDPQLSLPWAKGQSWTFSGGAHGWNGRDDEPWSALDFAGGDGQVRAAGAGLYYQPCGKTTMVQIHHGDGWVTDYYHLTKLPQLANGTEVGVRAYVGRIGRMVACGGRAFGAHVHFNIRYAFEENGQVVLRHIAWDDGTTQRAIGGWTIHKGSAQYQGFAEKVNPDGTTTRVNVGELLYNDGSPYPNVNP